MVKSMSLTFQQEEQLADLFIKPLGKSLFEKFRNKLQILSSAEAICSQVLFLFEVFFLCLDRCVRYTPSCFLADKSGVRGGVRMFSSSVVFHLFIPWPFLSIGVVYK